MVCLGAEMYYLKKNSTMLMVEHVFFAEQYRQFNRQFRSHHTRQFGIKGSRRGHRV